MHDHGQATREAAPLCAASDFGVPSSLHFNCRLLVYGRGGRHAFPQLGENEGQGRASKILSETGVLPAGAEIRPESVAAA